jgi:hypothetical protein
MVPNGCACSCRCLAKLDVWLLFRYACLCLLYLTLKLCRVCPMYALWHSVQVSLYIPDSANLSGGGLCGVSSLPMVLFVWKATLRFVCLNKFVMYDVSLPVCEGDPFIFCGFCRGECVGYGFLMVFSSCLLSSFSRPYVCSLLNRKRTAEYVCCAEWLEVYGMMVSVKVGFLYIEVFRSVAVLCKDMSRKFKVLSFSVSAVNCSLWC